MTTIRGIEKIGEFNGKHQFQLDLSDNTTVQYNSADNPATYWSKDSDGDVVAIGDNVEVDTSKGWKVKGGPLRGKFIANGLKKINHPQPTPSPATSHETMKTATHDNRRQEIMAGQAYNLAHAEYVAGITEKENVLHRADEIFREIPLVGIPSLKG